MTPARNLDIMPPDRNMPNVSVGTRFRSPGEYWEFYNSTRNEARQLIEAHNTRGLTPAEVRSLSNITTRLRTILEIQTDWAGTVSSIDTHDETYSHVEDDRETRQQLRILRNAHINHSEWWGTRWAQKLKMFMKEDWKYIKKIELHRFWSNMGQVGQAAKFGLVAGSAATIGLGYYGLLPTTAMYVGGGVLGAFAGSFVLRKLWNMVWGEKDEEAARRGRLRAALA